MKTCPYCGEEIQNTAKKCRYCGEWLKDDENKKTKEDVKVKQYGFWGRFFRKDLKLNKKRWHRMLIIVFFIILFGMPLKDTIKIMMNDDRRWVETIDKIENRIGNGVIQLSTIMNRGEHIVSSSYHEIGDIDTESSEWVMDEHFKNSYCAKSWDLSKIQKLSRDLNIDYDSRSNPTWNEILNTVKTNKCISIDSMGDNYEFLNYTLVKLDELNVVKNTAKANWHRIRHHFYLDFLFEFKILLILGLIAIVIYYKIIIYIIYGSYKKNNS